VKVFLFHKTLIIKRYEKKGGKREKRRVKEGKKGGKLFLQ
jgi:hypothetical protein